MAWVRNGVVLDHFWLLDLQIFRYGTGYGKGLASVQVIGPRQFSMILIIIGVVALVMDGSAPASDADTQTGMPTNSNIHGGDCFSIMGL
jgi:hypothetical protein